MEEGTYGNLECVEATSLLEQHRRDVVEQYLEYGIVMLNRFRNQGKTIEDVIESAKLALWYVKNERMQRISEELGQ
jgi:hypothetical protein